MGTETRFNICEIVKMMLNISVSKYERVERIVSELETQGFECIERKKKKLIMFEPFDKREIHIYFKKSIMQNISLDLKLLKCNPFTQLLNKVM